MGFFLPLYDSIEYDDNDGISISARGGGETVSRPKVVGRPVLDVPGQCLKVRHVARLVLTDVVVGRLIGGHFGAGGGGGRGGGRGGVECGVWCVVVS